jgi:EAL domain-containing protein (putative c-di-GMP-specific phosphodiesterase class I)
MHVLTKPDVEPRLAYLEYYEQRGGARLRVVVNCFPFSIGRSKSANHVIPTVDVSKLHAEIVSAGDKFRIRDLGSTNGTYVNGQRISEQALASGDIVHIAHREFRFVHESLETPSRTDISTTALSKSELPASVLRTCEYLRELLDQEAVRILFQPIIELETGAALGCEALGRGAHAQLMVGPGELFQLAQQCNLAQELSQLLRRVSIREARLLPAGLRIFLNLHPAEAMNEALLDSLTELRDGLRDGQTMVLEVHEEMVTDIPKMQWLRQALQGLGIELAYDDFGAGRARLAELAEAPPNFVKLDRSLVHDLDRATARQELIQGLCRGIKDLGIFLIAEGIETPAEQQACQNLGCRFGQGFLLGHPQPASLQYATLRTDESFPALHHAGVT